MKLTKALLGVVFLSLMTTMSAFAQKYTSRNSRNYEVVTLGVATDGTKAIKIYVTEKNKSKAIALAKKAAVEVCIFRGLPSAGTVSGTPALVSGSAESEFADYFEEFFAPGGKYLRYVNITSEGAIPEEDIIKVKGGVKVGVVVQIMYDNLRNDLQKDNIVKSLNYGF